MVRLTDIIKQGKVPEREKKNEKENSPTDKIRFKDLPSFRGGRTESVPQQETDKDMLLNAQFPKEREKAYTEVNVDKDELLIDAQFPKEGEKAYTEVKVEERGEEKNFDWLYEKAYSFIQNVMTVVASGGKISIDEGAETINQIVNNLGSIDLLYRKAIYTRKTLDPFISHSVNVAIYAIKIGIGLKYNKDQLTKLGIMALLHDIGMAKMPGELINKTEKLTSDEFAIIKKHPQYGYEILLTLGEDYRWLAEIALQEHEREGGQGYPHGLKGAQIAEYAKIIGIVDIYEALTHPRPQRKRFLPYEAVKEIIETQRGFFHPKIMRLLLTQLSVFPLHSYVRLNSNAIGKVVEIDENHPLSPTIQILYDSQGGRIQEKKIIKLAENSLLHIKDSIFEEDLPA